jgi:hypothetical protein
VSANPVDDRSHEELCEAVATSVLRAIELVAVSVSTADNAITMVSLANAAKDLASAYGSIQATRWPGP